MKFRILIIFLIGIFIFSLSCMNKDAYDKVDFYEVYNGDIGTNIGGGGNIKIETDSDWNDFLKNLKQKDLLPANIDFQKYIVIAIYLVEKPTDGYSVKITNMEYNGSKLNVKCQVIEPGLNCLTAQVLTYPIQIVKLKKIKVETIFVSPEKVIKDCF